MKIPTLRHCERSAAIHGRSLLDCFASLAMTNLKIGILNQIGYISVENQNDILVFWRQLKNFNRPFFTQIILNRNSFFIF